MISLIDGTQVDHKPIMAIQLLIIVDAVDIVGNVMLTVAVEFTAIHSFFQVSFKLSVGVFFSLIQRDQLVLCLEFGFK
jgi:hypothetical protein